MNDVEMMDQWEAAWKLLTRGENQDVLFMIQTRWKQVFCVIGVIPISS